LAADGRDAIRILVTRTQRTPTVKKIIFLAVLALGLAAVWRKVQADRAELDLWTEATTADD
jgi:hypothetical protein